MIFCRPLVIGLEQVAVVANSEFLDIVRKSSN